MLVSTLKELSAVQAWQLFKLRVDVFVVEQQCPYEEIDDIDNEATHILAYERDPHTGAELLAGTARVYKVAETSHIGRMCVAQEWRSTGLADRIFQQALALCDGPAELTAQSPLASWYANYGFHVCGAEFDWDGIPHLPMRKD